MLLRFTRNKGRWPRGAILLRAKRRFGIGGRKQLPSGSRQFMEGFLAFVPTYKRLTAMLYNKLRIYSGRTSSVQAENELGSD
jgi:hypothetical protein